MNYASDGSYVHSVERYGVSPYVYPMDGLGNLPEGFARVCAINGGTYMLDRKVEEILFNQNGEAWGIRVAGEDFPRDSQPQVATLFCCCSGCTCSELQMEMRLLLAPHGFPSFFGGLYLQNCPFLPSHCKHVLQDRST